MTAPSAMQIPGFRGDLITPDHHDYDDARAVWNGTVDRRPRLIARCSGTADVAAAVRFARDRDLEIAVRGGGHNVAGTAVCDDGIVIDLSAMRAVSVDLVDSTALVQGGALWGDVDHETQAHGLATTGGIVSHTGVGGVSLGGGIGWLMRKHGLTVDNLVEAEVVTAAATSCGRRPTTTPTCSGRCEAVAGTSASSARSGSRCTPSGPPSWPDRSSGRPRTPSTSCASTGTSSPTRPTSSGPSFGSARCRRCRWSTRTCTSGPPSRLPAATPDPSKTVSVSVRSASLELRSWIWSDPRCTSIIKRHRRHRPPWLALLLESHEPRRPVRRGHRHRRRACLRAATSPRSYAAIFHMGGAVARAPRDATAYPERNVDHNMSIDAVWLPEQDDTVRASETAWARAFLDALQPHHAGVYVNFLDSDDDTSRVREAYGDANYRRLVEVKATYDPENVFRNNKNIQPAVPAR